VIESYSDDHPNIGAFYVHGTPIAGGTSGGPIVGLDGAAFAMSVTGAADFSRALALPQLLDWRPMFLRGRSLGELLDEFGLRT
jgi:hypothetical protein